MRVMSSGRCVMLALAAAVCTSACAKAPTMEQANKEEKMSDQTTQSRTIDGYTYTTGPVEAQLGPHRYAFPANLYDNQMGPAPGGAVGLTIMWPGLQAAPPGTRPSRSMADHYRAIGISIDYIDAVPIRELLQRRTSTESTTEDGSVNREDPRRRLDLRKPDATQYGLTPYLIDEEKMAAFSKEYQKQRGESLIRNQKLEDEWYVARNDLGELATFIKCNHPQDGKQGLVIEGDLFVPDDAPEVATCTHYIVDLDNQLSLALSYPRVLLKDWSAIEGAARNVLNRYKVQ